MSETETQQHEAQEETPFLLSDDQITEIIAAVRTQDSDVVHAYLHDLSVSDKAELLAKVTHDDRQELLAMFGESLDPLVFAEMDYELARSCLHDMPPAFVASIISSLESDDALSLISHLDEDQQKEILHKLSTKTRAAVEEGLNFPEDSAGRLMQREAVAVPEFWTVGKTVDYLREAADDLPENFFDVFVIDNPAQGSTFLLSVGRRHTHNTLRSGFSRCRLARNLDRHGLMQELVDQAFDF